MENGVAKIYNSDGTKGTGFFCKIPLSKKNNILAFISNYHVIGESSEIEIKTYSEKHVKKIMALLNKNYQAPQICFDGYGILLMIVSPQDSVFEIRQLRSYNSLIDSAIYNAIIKTEPLLPTMLNTCDSSFCAPLMLFFNNH